MANNTLAELMKSLHLTDEKTPSLDSWKTFLSQINSHFEDVSTQQQELIKNHDKAKRYALQNSKTSTLGELIGGITHEINNPLAVIQLRADQLLENAEAGDFDREVFVKSLKSIDVTVKKISSIINGLRSFLKGGAHEPIGSHSIKKIAESTIALCGHKFQSHGVKLELMCLEDVEFYFLPNDISQLLIHLFNNAYDAVVDLDEKWVHLEIIRSENHFTIEVTDSGAGIPPQIQKQMLQPFFTTKEALNKAGVGLGIVQSLVESHGGKFAYDNNSAHTKFLVHFPYSQGLTHYIAS